MSGTIDSTAPVTLYEAARSAMRVEIDRYLRLSQSTDGFVNGPTGNALIPEDIELLAVGVV